jgi:hypothetical protein
VSQELARTGVAATGRLESDQMRTGLAVERAGQHLSSGTARAVRHGFMESLNYRYLNRL